MAKTVFVQGTYILANWLNAIFGGGAHKVWVANQAYDAGVVIKLSGGAVLRAIVGGVSGTEEPAAPGSLRGTVADNTVTWELFGGHLHDGKNMDGSAPKVIIDEVDDLGIWHDLPISDSVTNGLKMRFWGETPDASSGTTKARYTKNGKMVTLHGYLSWTKSTGTLEEIALGFCGSFAFLAPVSISSLIAHFIMGICEDSSLTGTYRILRNDTGVTNEDFYIQKYDGSDMTSNTITFSITYEIA